MFAQLKYLLTFSFLRLVGKNRKKYCISDATNIVDDLAARREPNLCFRETEFKSLETFWTFIVLSLWRWHWRRDPCDIQFWFDSWPIFGHGDIEWYIFGEVFLLHNLILICKFWSSLPLENELDLIFLAECRWLLLFQASNKYYFAVVFFINHQRWLWFSVFTRNRSHLCFIF